MIKLTICKGFLAITDENGQVYPGWVGDAPPSYPDLPPVDYVYRKCQERGYSPERTIDLMLRIFHRQRIIRGGFMVDIPLVIGLVGGAGAGKSCGGAAIAIFDFLLAGMKLVSNMDITVRVAYKQAEKIFRSEPMERAMMGVKDLEKMYFNACLFVDEVNMAYGDSRRAMSNRNLTFAYVLQERRKRNLCVIHTEQNEMWGDDRLRFATDLFIKASDAAYANGIPKPGTLGRKSHWKVYDTSGVINGEVVGGDDPRFIALEGDFHNTPFWHSYNTRQLQGLEDDEVDDDIVIADGAVLSAAKDKYKIGRGIAAQCIERGIDEITTAELWSLLGITGDKSKQTKIGADFKAIGIPVNQVGRTRSYTFGESRFSDNGG